MTEHFRLQQIFGIPVEIFADKFGEMRYTDQVSALRALAREYEAKAHVEKILRNSDYSTRLLSVQRLIRRVADELEEIARLGASDMGEH